MSSRAHAAILGGPAPSRQLLRYDVAMFDAVHERPWLIVGCGYTGAVLAAQLALAGARVIVARRDVAVVEALAARLGDRVEARAIDLARPETLDGAVPAGAVVVDLAPPQSPVGAAEEALVRAAARAHRIVYVSSTGVYAAGAGALVDESWPLAPITRTGVDRLAAERALTGVAAAIGVPAVILRPAGIYGPGRGVLARLRAGTLRIVGERDTAVSRVHVADLAQAIVRAGTARAVPSPVYNVADREAAPTRVVAEAAAAALGVPAPAPVAAGSVTPEVAGMLTADRRIDAGRLARELGWTPAFPTWREGLAEELQAEE
jgi:nucleoside-diphosphate-sugar epimerase